MGCPSQTEEKKPARPGAGDDGGCCSLFSSEQDSSGAAGLGGRIAYISAMEEIEAEIKASRYGTACRKLSKLLSWKSDPKGGIVYLLGSCELARGRNQAADEAWARVVPGSAFSERAIRGRLRLFHDSGQLAVAEQIVNDAAADPRNDRTALMALLVPTYSQHGRLDEAERLIEERWEHLNETGEGASETAIDLVRMHVELAFKPNPVEDIACLSRIGRPPGSR